MDKYTETLYLLGCYMVVADREINALEVKALETIILDVEYDNLSQLRNSIFSDADDKPDYFQLLNQLPLVCMSVQQKERAIRYVVQVACADGFVGAQKLVIISDIASAIHYDASAILQEEEQLTKELTESARLSRMQRLWGNVEKVCYDTFANREKQSTLNKMFGGLGFQSILESITDQALLDYSRVDSIMQIMDNDLQQTHKTVKQLSEKIDKTKDFKEISQSLETTNQHFVDLIEHSMQENREMLDKKQRNIRYFTIAFMGRTKAGKSTLHKVMTQELNDDIGVGKLRTTRYNRSWYWDKLRIVDTPGIGAPGGDVDTNIAKSIIDEADLICYVVTNDSIQETEFDFFNTIKERNKPLYIILNVKSNLSEGVRLRKFLENPTKWRDDTGRESLQGHFDRIHDKLDGKYNMNAVKIIPLHLLAAQLATCSSMDQSIAETLLTASNFLEFTNSIKSEVYDTGCLKKSMSVIEGSAYQIHQVRETLNADYVVLSNNLTILKNRYIKYRQFLDCESKRLIEDVKEAFRNAKTQLHNRASDFASQHYDDKNAGQKWSSDGAVKGILNRLNTRINNRMKDYELKVKSELEEMISDIQITIKATSHSDAEGGASGKNTQRVIDIIGSLVTLVTSVLFFTSIPWITIPVVIVFFIVRSLFKSREEKIRIAIEKLRQKIDNEINSQFHSQMDSTIAKIQNMTTQLKVDVDRPFNLHITSTESLLNTLKDVQSTCVFNESVVNSLIGFRILDFVGKSPLRDKKISELSNDELVQKYPVTRDWSNHTLCYNYSISCSSKQIQKAEAATQMNIQTKK